MEHGTITIYRKSEAFRRTGVPDVVTSVVMDDRERWIGPVDTDEPIFIRFTPPTPPRRWWQRRRA